MRLWAFLVVVVSAVATLPGCVSEERPQVVARDFLLAWQGERYGAAASYTTEDEHTVATALRSAAAQLGADQVELALGAFRQHDDVAHARFTARVDLLAGNGPRWTYGGKLSLRRHNGQWRIVWDPSVVHPKLRVGQRLALAHDPPARAPILDNAGKSLLRNTPVVDLGVRAGERPTNQQTVRALADLAGLDAEHAHMVVRSAPDSAFVPIVTVRRSEYRRMKPNLRKLEGLQRRSGKLELAPTPRFADHLLGAVGPATPEALRNVGLPHRLGDNIGTSGLQLAYQRRLSGAPETKVVAQNARGEPEQVLARWPGQPPRSVRTTLDRRVQAAAEEALAGADRPASLVAVDSESGEVLAAANRGFDYNAAFTGQFPPGEVFRIVSSAALLRTGLAADTRIPCPPRRTVGGKVFENTSQSVSARAPSFRVSFATSCTTAFVGLARRLPDPALEQTAETLGLGGSWSLPVDAFTGFLPVPEDDADKAAYMIGDGPIRVSPLSMALVAATVESGAWRPPQLVTEPATAGHPEPRPLPDDHGKILRRLMRSPVEQGAARAADLPGSQVYGMVGQGMETSGARVGAYAWFVGFRDGVAVALAVEGGTGPNQASAATDGPGGPAPAAVGAGFLRALGDGRR